MTFYCNGKKAFCTESECKDTACEYYNGEGGEYQHELVKLKTNADRIRAMSDEELAEFLERTHSNMAIKLGGEYIVREKEYIEIWLKQPAEEVNT